MLADYGNYYAWGEIETKDEYTTNNSVTYEDHDAQLSTISGDASYDAAVANLGGSWRMPTKHECQELVNDCTWTWTTQENSDGEAVNGFLVEGTNGNSIFLPAAGYRAGSLLYDAGTYGYYWSSANYTVGYSGYYHYAYNILFHSIEYYVYGFNSRFYGVSIRPVSE